MCDRKQGSAHGFLKGRATRRQPAPQPPNVNPSASGYAQQPVISDQTASSVLSGSEIPGGFLVSGKDRGIPPSLGINKRSRNPPILPSISNDCGFAAPQEQGNIRYVPAFPSPLSSGGRCSNLSSVVLPPNYSNTYIPFIGTVHHSIN